MSRSLALKTALGCLSAVCFTGCAAAYHAYPNGCVPYSYHAPAPLPYTQYSNCPTPIAARYFERRADTSPARSLPQINSEYYPPQGDVPPRE
jgi:hypothetical protein